MGANISAGGGSANPITNITSMAKDIFGGWGGKGPSSEMLQA
jgi:hypothetical protein